MVYAPKFLARVRSLQYCAVAPYKTIQKMFLGRGEQRFDDSFLVMRVAKPYIVNDSDSISTIQREYADNLLPVASDDDCAVTALFKVLRAQPFALHRLPTLGNVSFLGRIECAEIQLYEQVFSELRESLGVNKLGMNAFSLLWLLGYRSFARHVHTFTISPDAERVHNAAKKYEKKRENRYDQLDKKGERLPCDRQKRVH
ncbi:MAG: hypothetical protein RLZZ416_255 [Candidatus Parcubacteria bacterium]|jgi:hypothetical protein